MDFGVVIYRELRVGIVGQNFLNAVLVFIPTVVFQGSDVKEHMLTFVVELRSISGIARAPGVPDILHEDFVGSASGAV